MRKTHLEKACRTLVLVHVLTFSVITSLCAQEIRDNEKEFSIYIQPSYVENASGAPASEAQINETHIEYGADANISWFTPITETTIDYNVSETTFSEDTQPDDSLVEGESRFFLGNQSTFYELELQHSRRRFLRSPGDSPILIANTLEREIVSASPGLKTRLGVANNLRINYAYSDVNFGSDGTNNSIRKGYDLQYFRDVSAMRNVGLIYSERTIRFDVNSASDSASNSASNYATRRLGAMLQVEHRLFDYEIQAGIMKITSLANNESYHRPALNFRLNWQQAANQLAFLANRSTTDSSLGSANSSFFNRQVSFDGTGETQDQIDRTSFELPWVYSGVCQRCQFNSNLALETLDYLNFSENDARQSSFSVGFDYQFSNKLTGRSNVLSSATKPINENPTPEAENEIVSLNLIYTANRNVELSVTHEQDRRRSEVIGDSLVKTTSLNVQWTF